jgi:hypothetical protein
MQITSSSISSSDRPARGARWPTFVATFAAASAAVLLALLGLLVALDPYDTGRFALVKKRGVPQQGPRTANASRGRDPAFDAGIFGNSHIQLIRPERLKAETGLDFVSLMVPATYPKEQFVVLDWFMRHHAAPEALVFGLDQTWCFDSLINTKPFPFWLYEENVPAFLRGLFRYSVLERIPGRLALLAGKIKPARPDGFWDYDADYRKIGYGEANFVHSKLAGERQIASYNPRAYFPAAEKLAAVLAKLPPPTAVLLVWPPVFIAEQPVPGSPMDATWRACHQAYADIAAGRPRSAMLDWAVDRPENRVEENFFDKTHYRGALAAEVEADIAAALNRLRRNGS